MKETQLQANENQELLTLIPMHGDLFKLVQEMLESKTVTVGFNRKPDGLALLVPIDLTVTTTHVTESGEVSRERSEEAITSFAKCYGSLLKKSVSLTDE
jgi:hypothetical protein